MSNEQFENWKESFIINKFADNIYFKVEQKLIKISNPVPPEINIWTAQPKNAIKTQNHL